LQRVVYTTTPRAIAKVTRNEFTDNVEAPLVLLVDVGLAELADPVPTGAPVYPVASPVRGPGPAEADAPRPTRFPSPWPDGPLKFLALFWYAANVLLPDSGALIAPTMPDEQWVAGKSCLQKNQMGLLASVIVKFHSGGGLTPAFGMETHPESNPPGIGSQGSVKVDWVILWFPGAPVNWKVIVVPLVAFMVDGLN